MEEVMVSAKLRVLAFCRRATGATVLLLLTSTAALGQQTGTLTGVVRDAQAAVLPGVTVTVSGESLIGGTRNTVTGAAGSYQFTLPPGTYTVMFELGGF